MSSNRMKRFCPCADDAGWRVYDTVLERFAPGFGAKPYADKQACAETCARLNDGLVEPHQAGSLRQPTITHKDMSRESLSA